MQKSEYQQAIVNRIRQLRLSKNVSQVDLAKLLGISNGQMGNIESPKYQHKYTLKQLYQLTGYLNVSFEYLLTGSEEKLTTEELIKALISYE